MRWSLSREALLPKIVALDFLAIGPPVITSGGRPLPAAHLPQADVLYPPLTSLKRTGSTQEVGVARGGKRPAGCRHQPAARNRQPAPRRHRSCA